MTFDKTTKDGLSEWILSLTNHDWCGQKLAKGLSEETLHFVARYFPYFDSKVKLAALSSILSLDKHTLSGSRTYLLKIVGDASQDSHEFVKTIGKILVPYVNDNQKSKLLDGVDLFFARFIRDVDRKIHGRIRFHSMEDLILQPSVMKTGVRYNRNRHFFLTKDKNDLVNDDERRSIFKTLIAKEESLEKQQQQLQTRRQSTGALFNTARRSSYNSPPTIQKSSPGPSFNRPQPPRSASLGSVPTTNASQSILYTNHHAKATTSTLNQSKTTPLLFNKLSYDASTLTGFKREPKTKLVDLDDILKFEKEPTSKPIIQKNETTDITKKEFHGLQPHERTPDVQYAKRSAGPMKSPPTSPTLETSRNQFTKQSASPYIPPVASLGCRYTKHPVSPYTPPTATFEYQCDNFLVDPCLFSTPRKRAADEPTVRHYAKRSAGPIISPPASPLTPPDSPILSKKVKFEDKKYKIKKEC